jgi:hypothetical protein
MKETKEAIVILEKVLAPLDACEPQCKLNLNPEEIRKALDILRKQPPAGDFTKECLQWINGLSETSSSAYVLFEAGKLLVRACARLDAYEARVTDLVEACKDFCQEFCDYGRITHPRNHDWRHNQEYKEEIINKFEAAIKKAGEI